MNDSLLQQAELIAGYLQGSLSTEQEKQLSGWVNASPDNRRCFDRLTNPETLRAAITRHDEKRTRVISELNTPVVLPHDLQQRWWIRGRERIGLAAAMLVILLTILFLWFTQSQRAPLTAIGGQLTENILPGSDQARLYLEDSLIITMVDTVNGMLALQSDGDVKILKENGWLFYHSANPGDTISYNALEVPRNGRYRVALPDGSRVWLNNESHLRYPVLFGNSYRRVRFDGEGYFEVTGLPATIANPITYAERVALAKSLPFQLFITTGEAPALLQATGAQFCIRAYPEDDYIEVLVLDGTVQLTRGASQISLQRNQLGRIYHHGKTSIRSNVPASRYTAWKDNRFQFEQTPLQDAMKDIDRWYDVQTKYSSRPGRHTVTGVFPRDIPLSQLLQALTTATGIHFSLSGREVTVLP